jgi:amphi-Trp domain-containing protein
MKDKGLKWEETKNIGRKEAGELLETLGRDIAAKSRIEFLERSLVLPESFEIELEYKKKHGRNKLEIELKWCDDVTKTALNIAFPDKITKAVKVTTLDKLLPWRVIHFAYPTEKAEAILIVLPDGKLRAYSTICPHKGKGLMWDDKTKKLNCPAHGAVFEPERGLKLKGPGGRFLTKIRLQVSEEGVFAVAKLATERS